MIAMIPVITAIMASIFLKEQIGKKQIACILIAVLGVVFINIQGMGKEGSSMLGRILIFIAVICGSGFNICSRKLSESKFTPIEITAAMQLVGAISFASISIGEQIINGNINNYISTLLNINIIIPIVYLGVGCSLGAMFLTNYSLSKLEAAKSSILANIATIVSIVAGVLLLNESFSINSLIGSIMIIGSVIVIALSSNKEEENLKIEELEINN